jgi:hypothetical protein
MFFILMIVFLNERVAAKIFTTWNSKNSSLGIVNREDDEGFALNSAIWPCPR